MLGLVHSQCYVVSTTIVKGQFLSSNRITRTKNKYMALIRRIGHSPMVVPHVMGGRKQVSLLRWRALRRTVHESLRPSHLQCLVLKSWSCNQQVSALRRPINTSVSTGGGVQHRPNKPSQSQAEKTTPAGPASTNPYMSAGSRQWRRPLPQRLLRTTRGWCGKRSGFPGHNQ